MRRSVHSRHRSQRSRCSAVARQATRFQPRFETLEPRYALDSTVVFNEAMFHPASGDPALEWVELYNQLSVAIDLGGWRLAGGVEYRFSEGTVLEGGDYLVVAASPSALQGTTGYANALGPFTGALSDAGELIELRDRNERIMDALDYGDDGAWPVAADGGGASLAKRDPLLSTAPPEHWSFSRSLSGTPGADNRIDGFVASTPIVIDSDWKYHDLGVDLGTAWREVGFDDASWTTGAGLFYDDADALPGPKNTPLSAGANAYYFRKSFSFNGNPADVSELTLDMTLDDGAVVYLNGMEVKRVNMPSGATIYATPAASAVDDAAASGPLTISSSGLVQGVNVIAVEVHQAQPGATNTLAYYRFEESSGTSVVDAVGGAAAGELIGATRTTDVPSPSVPQTGAANARSVNFTNGRAAMTGQPFLFHDPSVGGVVGSATLEWYMKVPVADDHSAIFWSNSDSGDANRFNIFWNASFTGVPGSERTVSGDFHTIAAGHSDIGVHGNGNAVPLDAWRHYAIVRIDNTPANPNDANFTWNWYIDGALSPAHTRTTTSALPTSNNGWLIAGRQGANSQGVDALIDEVRFTQGALAPSQFLNATGGASVDDEDAVFGAALRVVERKTHPSLALNELSAGGGAFQVELANYGDTTINLGGYVLRNASGAAVHDFEFPAQLLAPGAFLALTGVELGFSPQAGDRMFLYAPNRASVVDAQTVESVARGRLTTGLGEWGYPHQATFGAANAFPLHDEIVINEVMYHHQVVAGVAPETVQDSPEEWIELYHRGSMPTDLSGWRIVDAVDFAFPAGTTLSPGQYLVVANNAPLLRSAHPNATIIGDFSRNLSNGSDRIVLLDARGNRADEVRYFDEKPWPEFADGGGSSLELRDPDADNGLPESWGASDEATASVWQTYTHRGIAGPSDSGTPQYHEFVLGMLDAGEVLLDDISVMEDPSGARRQLIQNGSFANGTTSAWRILGNHHGDVVDDPANPANKVLRLNAQGRTDEMHNHVETTLKSGGTFVSIVPGREYEISYRAKWLGGGNLLNTRLYFSRLQKTTRLDVPQTNGTPGRANSRLVANLGPGVAQLAHSPAVPAAGQPTTISARIADRDGVASAQIRWRVDDGSWNVAPLSLGSDGIHVGTVPGQPAGTKVQFFVRTSDALGATSDYPAGGEASRAMYRVEDGQAMLGVLHNVRIVMNSADLALFDAGANLMSNDLLGATVIVNESEIYYDVGVRRSGAASSRQGAHGVRIAFLADQLYRGVHETVTIDRNHNEEIFVRQLIQRAGDIPGMVNDLIYLVGPSSSRTGFGQLRMAGFEDVYLDSQYANGGDGNVYEKELIYRQQLSNPGNVESLKVPFGYTHPVELNTDLRDLGSDKEAYRWNWLIKNHRDVDDYSGVVELNQALSLNGAALDAATRAIMDVDQWMRALASIRLLGNRDFYSQPKSTGAGDSWRHNFWAYQRPSDGLFLLFPSDIDENFQVAATDPAVFGNENISKVILLPQNLHHYWGHLDDLINVAFNATYMTPWASRFSALLGGQDMSSGLNYIVSRADYIRSRMPAAENFRLDVAPGSPPAVVDQDFVDVTGRGWINVREIKLAGQSTPLPVTWTSPTTWTARAPLRLGANTLDLEAYDFQGNRIAAPFANSVVVTSTASQRPYQDFLQISELMYHPGDPTPAEIAAGFVDAEEFEFVEFYNSSPVATIDLNGVRIVSGPSAEFALGAGPVTSLGPGEYVLAVRNKNAFEARYGTMFSPRIAGQYQGRFDNAGELVAVIDPTGADIHRFTYDDNAPWPTEPDGSGRSLVLAAPVADPDPAIAANWRPSFALGGSPGEADQAAGPVGGDFDLDGDVEAADLAIWQGRFGEGTGATQGDGDGDRDADGFDFLLWQRNLGRDVVATSDAVGQVAGAALAAQAADEPQANGAELGRASDAGLADVHWVAVSGHPLATLPQRRAGARDQAFASWPEPTRAHRAERLPVYSARIRIDPLWMVGLANLVFRHGDAHHLQFLPSDDAPFSRQARLRYVLQLEHVGRV